MRKRVLIVEDDDDIGVLLLSALRDERRDVFLARDLDAARAMCTEDMDVIVLDIALPRGTEGLRFLDWYFTGPRRGKVVVLSAIGREILDQIRADPRVATVMNKPFALEQLLATVEELSDDD